MAKKWTKGIVGLAAIGAAAAGILYMKNKKDNEDLEDEFADDFEDLDFDLDDDLSDTSGREYVPLNNTPSEDKTEKVSAEEEEGYLDDEDDEEDESKEEIKEESKEDTTEA